MGHIKLFAKLYQKKNTVKDFFYISILNLLYNIIATVLIQAVVFTFTVVHLEVLPIRMSTKISESVVFTEYIRKIGLRT